MCIALPLKITQVLSPGQAVCEASGTPVTVNVSWIDDPRPGEWITVHRGLAVNRLTDAEAQLTLNALSALDRLQAGDADIDHLFADLVDREPPRP